ncbi:hypothetical protein J7T55_010950 [Diaporthe amygdali]|uniref:uncharacterized protein n=1 Tax=Phomopsis amygdali TaxID=1214568 RepID=UPI0022FE38E1|nr:uncharacterized protein J7T55_010950 [Diaporthe amygdali]KAJ0103933.1 hypothetical protein J7T55_010950 [Diaporthe amygdali]
MARSTQPDFMKKGRLNHTLAPAGGTASSQSHCESEKPIVIVVQALAAVVRGSAEDVQDLELPAPARVLEGTVGNWPYTDGTPLFTMKSTAAEIEAALAKYRKVSAERNKRLLEVYIDAITKAEFTDELIREEISDEEHCLDGTKGGHLDLKDRAARATAYFNALDAALKAKAPEEVKQIISAPEEFRILVRHVLGINGPMLPDDMTKHAMSFWQDDGMQDA